jgi:PIN domain nuclease of toxin-antitoxin system
MKYLLDTHTLIWFLDGADSLPISVRNKIKNADENYISIASLWEITIKTNLGKIKIQNGLELLFQRLIENSIFVLPIKFQHLLQLNTLPFIHKDPFDRLLFSSAIAENLTLLTIDENIQKYDFNWRWE